MERAEVVQLIRECLERVNAERATQDRFAVSEETPLLAEESPLDSLEFVAFSSDLEAHLRRRLGRDLGLVGDALDEVARPFSSAGALADHVVAKLRT